MDSTQQPKRKDRPCDACRKRKSRCVIEDSSPICVLCKFHSQDCTFLQSPQVRKRKVQEDGDERDLSKRRSSISSARSRASPKSQIRVIRTNNGTGVEEYDDLEGPSLLKRTLGLRNQHHSQYVGATRSLEPALLGELSATSQSEVQLSSGILRRVSPNEAFVLLPDPGTQGYSDELEDLDAIEDVVRPYGKDLVNMYFRIVFPSFPILHKEVYLEKYSRSYREFSPPLLAAVYLLALYYWSYDDRLNKIRKPDVQKLEKLARKALGDTIHRPKLSTVQAGLLLLQHADMDSAELTAQLISIGFGLGLHLDASDWTIPPWEKGLRKRLGWALFIQDKWGSLLNGRPTLINFSNWALQPVTNADFPENAAHENEQEGSTEVEKGRILFSHMISLSIILSDLLDTVFTVKTLREITRAESNGLHIVLEKVKPVQLRLKDWFANLPDCLSMQSTPVMKLNSVGYLRLAYIATEITLHRRILLTISPSTDPQLQQICRSVAHERFVFATEFVQSLKPQHLSSFWYCASSHNFSLIAVFGCLLLSTASSSEEAAFYERKLKEYRWSLKINSENGARYMRPAMAVLDVNVGLIREATSVDTVQQAAAIIAKDFNTAGEIIPSPGSYAEGSPLHTDDIAAISDFTSPVQFSFGSPYYPSQQSDTVSPKSNGIQLQGFDYGPGVDGEPWY